MTMVGYCLAEEGPIPPAPPAAFDRFSRGIKAGTQAVFRKADHQLNTKLEPVVLNQRAGPVDRLAVVSSSGSFQHTVGEGLHSQFNYIHTPEFQVIQNFFINIVRSGGKVDFLNQSLLFIRRSEGQIAGLLF